MQQNCYLPYLQLKQILSLKGGKRNKLLTSNLIYHVFVLGEPGDPFDARNLTWVKGYIGPEGPRGNPGTPGRPGYDGELTGDFK